MSTLHMIEPERIVEMVKALADGEHEFFQTIECTESSRGNTRCTVRFTQNGLVDDVVFDWCDYELAGAWCYLDSKTAQAFLFDFFYQALFEDPNFISDWEDENPNSSNFSYLSEEERDSLTVFDIFKEEVCEKFLNLWTEKHSVTKEEMLTSDVEWKRNLANHKQIAKLRV